MVEDERRRGKEGITIESRTKIKEIREGSSWSWEIITGGLVARTRSSQSAGDS